MSKTQNNTTATTGTDTDQAATNGFNTFMVLRERGVDRDTALRAADHVVIATNKDGEKGATAAAARILIWLGLGVLVIVSVLAFTRPAAAAAPASAPANIINLPLVGNQCRTKCVSTIPMPTITPTAIIAPPVTPAPPAPHSTIGGGH